MEFNIQPCSAQLEEKLQHKVDMKTKPPGSLGKLETLALQIGKIQNTLSPKLEKPKMFVFAGDHGIAHEGVSPFPQEVTYQMVMNFVGGGAAINAFTKQNGIELSVIDAGVNYEFPQDLPIEHQKIGMGTANFLNGPAMTIEQCQEAMAKGAANVQKAYEAGTNCAAFGEMGIANTSSSAMLMHYICGVALADCIGKGTGHTTEGMQKKQAVLEKCAENYSGSHDALELLAYFGGFETAMVCGAFLKAAELKMTILVDGFNITAALLCAAQMFPAVLDYCIAAHCSDEKGHQKMLEFLNLEPVLFLGMRLGEGTGAAVAYPILQSAVHFLNQMASFEDAGVSNA